MRRRSWAASSTSSATPAAATCPATTSCSTGRCPTSRASGARSGTTSRSRRTRPTSACLARRDMPGAEWFTGATLNYAEHMVGREEDLAETAVLAISQTRDPFELTFADLREQVGAARAGLQRLGRRAGRPGGGLPAQHPRDAGGVPGRGEPRRRLGHLRAGVRAAQRDRPLRHRRAQGAAGDRRLSLRREGDRPPRRGGRGPRRAAHARARGPRALRRRRRRRAPGHGRVGRPGRRAGAARVRPGPVRPPALRAVLVRHHGAAQGDRAPPRRDPGRALQEPRPELGHPARRPPDVVHHHRVDDVERARVDAAAACVDRDARRQSAVPRTRRRSGSSPSERSRR